MEQERHQVWHGHIDDMPEFLRQQEVPESQIQGIVENLRNHASRKGDTITIKCGPISSGNECTTNGLVGTQSCRDCTWYDEAGNQVDEQTICGKCRPV